MDYVIFTDATGDMDKSLITDGGIKIIPMGCIIGDESFMWDGLHDDREALHSFFDKLRNEKTSTSTSQVPPNIYYDTFEPYIKEGKGILYISISSGVSGTYASAVSGINMLKEDYADVHAEVIDSLCASFGEGMLIGSAAENKEKGMSLEENAAWLREHVMNVRCWVKLDDLMFLSRGGRLSSASAIVGTALNIKPIMFFDAEGKAAMASKKRGVKMALNDIIAHFESTFDPELGNTVYVVDTDNEKEAAELYNMLCEKHPELDIKRGEINPIVGSLLGPDVAGIVHYGTRKDSAK